MLNENKNGHLIKSSHNYCFVARTGFEPYANMIDNQIVIYL